MTSAQKSDLTLMMVITGIFVVFTIAMIIYGVIMTKHEIDEFDEEEDDYSEFEEYVEDGYEYQDWMEDVD